MAAPFARKLYDSKAWKQCRDAYVAYKHGICERCGAPGEEVHHKTYLTPGNINDPDIVFGWQNLELLCRSCHIEEHEKHKTLKHGRPAKESDIRIMFDENGQPVPRGQINIVYGCPYSGKAAYVHDHMRHMDIVIDMDRMMPCFTGLSYGVDDPSAITDYLPAMLAIRSAVYGAIRDGLPGVRTVWIVAGLPRKADRQQLLTSFPQASFTYIKASYDQCVQNATRNQDERNQERQRRIVTDWFRCYEPD